MEDKKKIVCHASGDRCHGCDHYKGITDICKFASTVHPSDSEIEKVADEKHWNWDSTAEYSAFIEGAKWMRDRMNGEIAELVNFLKSHEQWEADFIS